MDKYAEDLLNAAIQLDNAADTQGVIIQLSNEIVRKNSDIATQKIFNIISNIIKSNDVQLLQVSKNLNDCLLRFYGYQKVQGIFNRVVIKELEKVKTEEELLFPELLSQLTQLVGLTNVKSKVYDLISYQKVQQLRKNSNLLIPTNTLHLAFTGNPGTGKTTVARIVGRIYKHLGLLTKGHFIEVSRTDLVAGYQGQTALKVKKVIEKAKGGVLFIDEAYSITENDHSDSYGKECLTELTKALEDYREDLVVIVAGYTDPMNKFFNSNPGLKSRFNTFIEFNDYSDSELVEILLKLFENSDYDISANGINEIKDLIDTNRQNPNGQFSNGRFIRNIYEDLIMQHARRVSEIEQPSIRELKEITETDISAILENL